MLGQIAGLVFILGFMPYIYSILKGETKPSRTTWVIWAVIGAISLIQDYAVGSRDSIWVSLGAAIGPLSIALLSLKYGTHEKDSSEKYYFIGSAIALLVWFLTGSPILGLALNILIDFIGAMPTIIKTWKDPYSEDLTSWLFFLVGNSLNLFAVDKVFSLKSLYPLYLFFIAFVIVALSSKRFLIRDKRLFV